MLEALSFEIVPLAIAIFSIVALLFWESDYPAAPDKPLPIRVVSGDAARSPSEAMRRLEAAPAVVQHETRLSEAPVWFMVRTRLEQAAPAVLEFPSRHTVDIACWNGETLAQVGTGSRTVVDGDLFMARSGFALRVSPSLSSLVCRAQFSGPARLSVLQWQPAQFEIANKHYQRKSGLLDGGMLVLAMFVLMIALVNREKIHVLFAAWLFLNLRVAALSAGWDVQWLGQRIPEEFLSTTRTVTIALFALVTIELYRALFREILPRSRFDLPLRITHWMTIPLLFASLVLPFRHFLPVMWMLVGIGLLVLVASLASIVAKTRSKVAYWLAAAFCVMFLSSLSEVIAAALGVRQLVDVVNSVTAALASSILAALAIAERMRLEHAQRLEAQAALEHTYEVMPIGLFTLDASGRLLSANPALACMLDTDTASLARHGWMRYFRDGTWTALHEMVHRSPDGQLEVRSKDGQRRFLVRAALSQGRIEGFLQDVTEQAKATEDLLFMANNDPLTKVFNRRGIEAVFNRARTGSMADRPMALAYLDLDRFKLINDLFGHAAGDEVLKQVCQRISSVLAANHQLGRVGGDEFLIVMPDTNITLASLICQGVVTSLGKDAYRVGDKAFHVRGSIGLVEVVQGVPMKDAVSAADRACREAKDGQGEGVVVYERNASAFHERQAELALVERLSGHEPTRDLFLEMQPIMSLTSPHDSLNFEVLLRMRDADGSTIQAGRIIAAAEKSGFTGMIDRWVLSSTLAWIEENFEGLHATRFVCMNLSGASLNDERFIQDTLGILEEYPRGARLLCIEITESVALHDLDNTRRFIDQIRSRGVRVALDDFGAGYTSFSYLKELPADVLKIDGHFIMNINAHPANVAIVEAIVKLAMNLGMKTIAEWAEDADTARTLSEIGVDYVQGFVIARSQLPEKILAAPSAASFIADEAMLSLLKELDTTEHSVAFQNVVNLKDLQRE